MAYQRPYAKNSSEFKSIENELKSVYGGFMQASDLCDYHKCSINTAKKYMAGFKQYKMPGSRVPHIRTVDYAKYLSDEAVIL